MTLAQVLGTATALAFTIATPSLAATNPSSSGTTEGGGCSDSRPLTRLELADSNSFISRALEKIEKEEVEDNSTHTTFQVTQGYRSASSSGKLQLDTFIVYTPSGTYAIQRLYNPSNPEATLKETLSRVSTNLKLESSFKVISTTSNETTPQDAPRSRCKTLDWNCAQNRCGWAVKICKKRIPCMAVLCIYAVGSCCTEWEPNPYQ